MFNVTNINESFNKYRNILIDAFVLNYGEEYRETITKRFNSILFDFTSNPEDDYEFLLNYGEQVSKDDEPLIKESFVEYTKVKENSLKKHQEIFLEYICKMFNLEYESLSSEDKDNIIGLFMDENFNGSLIDSFSSKSFELCFDPKTPEVVKESFTNDQMKFVEKSIDLGIEPSVLDASFVDEIIRKREEFKKSYETYIAKNSEYGQNLYNLIYDKFLLELSDDALTDFLFRNADSFCISLDYGSNLFIKFPMIKLVIACYKRKLIPGLDCFLIHEIIHAIESPSYKKIGIKYDNKNEVANELRTQMLAIKITNYLHDNGIFIFDNPNNCTTYGNSIYDPFIPLFSDFFNEIENLILKCAIDNEDCNLLDEYLGDEWSSFSEWLDKEFDRFVRVISTKATRDYTLSNNYYLELIEAMRNNYYNKVNNKQDRGGK